MGGDDLPIVLIDAGIADRRMWDPSRRSSAADSTSFGSDLLGESRNLNEASQCQLLQVVTDQLGPLQRQGQIPVVKVCLTCRFFDGYAHPGA